ncbi:PleD family two-component system response regulator [Notoacmeibacter sp. MSK16QG-6]|uniref:PleD family two-component system response regulator n=1 Tax=Notoacmeibacter sp. MSK16QG-6 TaxID=2957982 RepID=UPI00209DA1BA|nr:PleD family two-component system response regulator [Notoacmeibacter sp. MSK16QG-6]MCP1197894.1 PleD family two-component system response regulator [Notoacmeibacter sp. MSK16QG-6]
MTARILVVDDVPANILLLQTRLSAEYFDVVTAENGLQALKACAEQAIDVVLLDIMMPDMDGYEVCERLKADPETAHIPVVMVTALDQQSDRVRGLRAGADDFLTKPVDTMQLLTRVKSLVRLKNLSDELRLRAATSRTIAITTLLTGAEEAARQPSILLIDEREGSAACLSASLEGWATIKHQSDPQTGFFDAVEGQCDLVMVATGFKNYDPLRIIAQLRSIERTRFTPLMLIANPEETDVVTRALELGVNDYVTRPVEPQELKARITTQLKRKHFHEGLRASLTETLQLAITDPLTGLHNRRYLEGHLQTLFDRAVKRGAPLSLMMMDLDFFKQVNDRHGHDGGDAVLREFAQRLRRNVRGMDLACRYGGEEFIIIMPETDQRTARQVAERLRAAIEASPFPLGPGKPDIDVTVSIGVSSLGEEQETTNSLLKRADMALYSAKENGRNRVIDDAA